jgi:tetrahydromethanopterin S-methyltransferase subunit G
VSDDPDDDRNEVPKRVAALEAQVDELVKRLEQVKRALDWMSGAVYPQGAGR